MKYKVGDRVRIKDLTWYDKNKSKRDTISFPYEVEIVFTLKMSSLCGQIVTISKTCYTKGIGFYCIREDCGMHMWIDEMIEGLVEEETKPKFKVGDKVMLDSYPCKITDVHWRDSLHGFVYTVRGTDFGKVVKEDELVFDERPILTTDEIIKNIKADWNNFKDRYNLPNDYHFVDKNGNEINISEIVLEKKKKEYPKTYEKCCKVLGIDALGHNVDGYKWEILSTFQNLIICRDAYWKIAGEGMGLGKPWEPDWDHLSDKWVLFYTSNRVGFQVAQTRHSVFAFPTKEMRDAFKENFKELIDECKELL